MVKGFLNALESDPLYFMFQFINNELVFNGSNPMIWVDLGASLIIIGALIYLVLKVFKRLFVKSIILSSIVVLLLSWAFGLNLLHDVIIIVLTVSLVVCFTANIGEVRTLIVNSLSSKKSGKISLFKSKEEDKLFDREALYDKIETTINNLSKTKTGALITFEKNVSLADIAKSGTILHAPVIPELLSTIFYTGTRLHDGAVIIRRDEIYAAAVYYTPTTKPLTGKFGSRHRAAIGISEITDSVTIVVSEETGRVSLAVAGDLIHVGLDNFRRVFEDYMNSSVQKDELKDIA